MARFEDARYEETPFPWHGAPSPLVRHKPVWNEKVQENDDRIQLHAAIWAEMGLRDEGLQGRMHGRD